MAASWSAFHLLSCAAYGLTLALARRHPHSRLVDLRSRQGTPQEELHRLPTVLLGWRSKSRIADQQIQTDEDTQTAIPSTAPETLKKLMGDFQRCSGRFFNEFQQGIDRFQHMLREDSEEKLAPFQPGQPAIDIDETLETLLAQGEVLQNLTFLGNAVIGQAVMNVDASPSIVWNHLFDFASYTQRIPRLNYCKVYKRKLEEGSSDDEQANSNIERIFVKFVISLLPGVEWTSHVEHVYEPAKNSITWTLDEEKNNCFKELQGHWHVQRHPDSSSKSRVFYEVGLVSPRWIPRWLTGIFARRNMNEVTSWVRKESELSAIAQSGSPLLPELVFLSPKSLPSRLVPLNLSLASSESLKNSDT